MKRYCFYYRIILLILFALLFSIPSFAASLSDREAKKFIEESFNSPDGVRKIRLGKFTVYKDKTVETDYDKGTMSNLTYSVYQDYEKAGIISIKQLERKPPKALSLEPNYLNEIAYILVTASPKGLDLSKRSGRQFTDDCIFLKEGNFYSIEVVKNEEHKKGINEYRILMIKYKVEWEPVHKEIIKIITKKDLSNDRKAIILLKYDDFESKWKLIAADYANLNEDFSTNKVNNALNK